MDMNYGDDDGEEEKVVDWEINPSKIDIKCVIARGGFGIVCRGFFHGQEVAVKVLDWGEDGVTKIDTLRASFHQEVAVWYKLDHPNVTRFIGASMGTSNLKIPPTNNIKSSAVHNCCFPSRPCCVVVEYLLGGTLRDYLKANKKKKLPFKVVIQLALDLSRGLNYLHSQNIVHRDIKPENLLLDAHHKTLKITDFGRAEVEAYISRGKAGTYGYMAPEVFDGKPYNHKCDVYSFGICLWEMYCCDEAYLDVDYRTAMPLNLQLKIPKCCPPSLANVMERCWDADPRKRPDMEEVVRLLEGIDTSKGGGMIPKNKAHGCFCYSAARGR